MTGRFDLRLVFCLWLCSTLGAQVIEFESNGLRYQTLTRSGLTVMFAQLPVVVQHYAILQVAVSNGGRSTCSMKPEDFSYKRADGQVVRGVRASEVVDTLIEKGNRGDVVKLVSTYESALYGISRLHSPSGYEQRRQAALAEVSSTRLKAAAAASAIAFVPSRLLAGQSTDGAVFFATAGKHLGPGRLSVRTPAGIFEFEPVTDAPQ
ncbi:MAG: hypothetical protein ACKV22_18785 [Bryobacteraceae bacterium]